MLVVMAGGAQRENIKAVTDAVKVLGVPDSENFQTPDLFEGTVNYDYHVPLLRLLVPLPRLSVPLPRLSVPLPRSSATQETFQTPVLFEYYCPWGH